MLGNKVINFHTEKIELLPDDIEILVSRQWCNYVITYLTINQEHWDLVHMISHLVEPKTRPGSDITYTPRFVPMTVGTIKKLISMCGDGTLCCSFPYNYDEIANKFLENKLGGIKIKIELLMADDKVYDVFELITTMEDEYLKRLALLYMKTIHNKKTEEIIENVQNSRRRTVNQINHRLY